MLLSTEQALVRLVDIITPSYFCNLKTKTLTLNLLAPERTRYVVLVSVGFCLKLKRLHSCVYHSAFTSCGKLLGQKYNVETCFLFVCFLTRGGIGTFLPKSKLKGNGAVIRQQR